MTRDRITLAPLISPEGRPLGYVVIFVDGRGQWTGGSCLQPTLDEATAKAGEYRANLRRERARERRRERRRRAREERR